MEFSALINRLGLQQRWFEMQSDMNVPLRWLATMLVRTLMHHLGAHVYWRAADACREYIYSEYVISITARKKQLAVAITESDYRTNNHLVTKRGELLFIVHGCLSYNYPHIQVTLPNQFLIVLEIRILQSNAVSNVWHKILCIHI